MSAPIVSILVPSYNHADFLSAALGGVQAQTMSDWEVILIDDGSKDGSFDLAREIADSDPRIQVSVNPENLGTYGTLERARSLASGRFVAVLNSDDLWAPTKLERQIELLAGQRHAQVCYTLGHKVDETGRIDAGDDVHGDWPRGEVQELLPSLLESNRVLASSVLFRAEAARFEPSLRYSGDWVALLGPALRAPFALVVEPLNYWRMHSHNTFVRSPGQVNEEVFVRRSILASFPKWDVSRFDPIAIRRGLGRHRMHLAALEVLRGNRTLAIRQAVAALAISPERSAAMRRLAAVLLPSARARLWPGDETVFGASSEDRRGLLEIS